MKISRIFLMLCLVCAAVWFANSQDKSSKNKKDEKKPIEIKTNLLVLDTNNKYVDDIKQEDLKIFEDGIEQKITSFTKKEPILNLGLVVDSTGSMRLQLDGIIGFSQILTKNLEEKDEAFLVRFVSSDKVTLLRDWTSDKSLLNRALDSIFIEGGQSAVIDGLYLATEQILKRAKDNSSSRFALVLISDCEDRDSFYTKTKLFEKLEGIDIQIFVLALTQDLDKGTREKSELFANELALRTGGTVYFPTSKENIKKPLMENLKPLVNELRAQYRISYTSTNQTRNNKSRKTIVQVADSEKGEKRQGFIRESFIVPKD